LEHPAAVCCVPFPAQIAVSLHLVGIVIREYPVAIVVR